MQEKATRLAVGIAALAAIVLSGAMLATAAQPPGAPPASSEAVVLAPDPQTPMAIALAVNVRRTRLYQQEDTAGAATLYTADATYIELMPVLQVLKGRGQIKGHLDELISTSAASIVPTITSAERNADGTILVSGDYLVLSREGDETAGHFVQTLRQDGGAWQIAMHLFARSDPLTALERDAYPHD